MELTKEEVLAAEKMISTSKIVVCQLETPIDTILTAFKLAKKYKSL